MKGTWKDKLYPNSLHRGYTIQNVAEEYQLLPSPGPLPWRDVFTFYSSYLPLRKGADQATVFKRTHSFEY